MARVRVGDQDPLSFAQMQTSNTTLSLLPRPVNLSIINRPQSAGSRFSWRMRVHIGMFYQIQVPRPWKATPEAERYQDMLEQVTYADEARFSSASRSQQGDTPSIEMIERGDYCMGDPDDYIRFLQRYEAAGVDDMIPLFQIGPITDPEVLKTLELFGKYVIPHFSKE